MMRAVHSFGMKSPDDVQEFGQILRSAAPESFRRIAVIGKVEGTATTNDFSRSLALRAIRDEIDAAGIEPSIVQIVLSTGCEGIISPGGYVFISQTGDESDAGGFRVGFGRSFNLKPEDLLSQRHIDHARRAVSSALEDCGLTADDTLLVLMKSPLLTHQEANGLPDEQARWAGVSGAARGVAALGMGVALGEIDPGDAVIGNLLVRSDLFSRRGMVFSGTETRACEAIVIGQSAGATSGPRLHCGLVDDLVDIGGMASIIAQDSETPIQTALERRSDLLGAFFKAGVSRDGTLRGRRTTVFSSDLDPDKHMRAAASGVLAALIGDCRMFVSGGCEHQAPDGGGVFAVVTQD